MFSTKEQLQHLVKAKRWFVDGTFKVVTKPFYQLFSIHAFFKQNDNAKQVPLVFVLMSKRGKQDYIAIFNKLLDICPEGPQVQGFVMDFEAGLWQAIRDIFPGSNMKGCVFHWSQAVLTHVGQVGLRSTFNHREGTKTLIKKTMASPFLPGNKIRPAFMKIKDQAKDHSPQITDLFNYIEDQWIESSLWSLYEWSVYKQLIRTNNDCEGWHRRVNSVGQSRMGLYKLVPLLLNEAKMVNLYHTLVSDRNLNRLRRNLSKRIDGDLYKLWDEYDNKRITTDAFLHSVSGYIQRTCHSKINYYVTYNRVL